MKFDLTVQDVQKCSYYKTVGKVILQYVYRYIPEDTKRTISNTFSAAHISHDPLSD